MACHRCGRRTLTLFLQDVVGFDLARRPSTIAPHQSLFSRPFSSRSRLSLQKSSQSHNNASYLQQPSSRDDAYLPFDLNSARKKSQNDRVQSTPPPFSRPPPPEPMEAQLEELYPASEPSIKIEDDFRDAQSFKSLSFSSVADEVPSRVVERPLSKNRLLSETELLAGKPDDADAAVKGHSTTPEARDRSAKMKTPSPKAKAISSSDQWKPVQREHWQIQKEALQKKFGDQGWKPQKRLSPDALEGIRALHKQHPETFTTAALASHFKVSPEAIRRILKSKWRPSGEEEEDRRARWDKRGEKIWTALVQKGVHPPKKWREMGVRGWPRRADQPKAQRQRDAHPFGTVPRRQHFIAERIM